MYHHVKKLMYTVRVVEPDPKFGNMLLEQFGGANGELAAAGTKSTERASSPKPMQRGVAKVRSAAKNTKPVAKKVMTSAKKSITKVAAKSSAKRKK